MKTIDWNEFKNGIANLNNITNEEITNIRCPNCNEKLYKITNHVFTSYPPKHKYICKNCNWEGYA